jgi:hypothetical protein
MIIFLPIQEDSLIDPATGLITIKPETLLDGFSERSDSLAGCAKNPVWQPGAYCLKIPATEASVI